MLEDTLEHQNALLVCSPCRPSLYLFHKTYSSGCGIALMTPPDSLPCHQSQLLTLVWILEPAALAMWSSWSVLIIIFHISEELWSSWRVYFLCSFTFMFMSPRALVTLTDPFLLSLHPETAFAQSAGSPYPLLVPLVSHLYGHLLHVWAWHAVSRGCVHVFHKSSTFSLGELESNEACSPVVLELSAAVPSSGSAMSQDGLEGGLAISYSFCSELGPVLVMACCHHPMWSCDHSQFQPLGSLHESSCCVDFQVNYWESSPILSVWRWLKTWQLGAWQGECP